MRYVVFILALLGAGASGWLGYRWQTEANDPMTPMLKPLLPPEKQTELDLRAKTYMILLADAAVGIVGAVLVLMRKGMIAALVLLAGGCAPAATYPLAMMFTSPLILAGLLAVFVRSPKPA